MIIATIGLWIVVGCLIFVCAIFQFRPHYWRTLTWGALIVIAGSAGPQLLPKCRGHEVLKWVRAVCIGVVIATGTFVSTLGWNQRGVYLKDRALLVAAASEWRLSRAYIHIMKQLRDDFMRRGGNLGTPVFVFPSVHDTRQVLTQATTFSDEKDLIHALTVYVMAVDRLAPALERIHSLCSQPIATVDMKKRLAEDVLGDKPNTAFGFFVAAHDQLGKALASRYQWSLDEATTRLDNSYLDAIEHQWLNVNLDRSRSN